MIYLLSISLVLLKGLYTNCFGDTKTVPAVRVRRIIVEAEVEHTTLSTFVGKLFNVYKRICPVILI